jgi:predicted RNA binding protein YcfA (HicA-like mRNA interferase family)
MQRPHESSRGWTASAIAWKMQLFVSRKGFCALCGWVRSPLARNRKIISNRRRRAACRPFEPNHCSTKATCIKTATIMQESIAVLDGFTVSLLRSVSGKEAIKAFIKAGGVVRRGKGDHVNIKMPNGQLITIPVTGDLKIGLLKSAIRKAGLGDDEFIILLTE